MKRQIKVNAVLFMLGALNILSFTCIASDTTKVYKNILVDVGRKPEVLDTNAIIDIRAASNDMFAADFVTVVYANESDKKCADKIGYLLLAEGIPPSRVAMEQTATTTNPAGKAIKSGQVLVYYKASGVEKKNPTTVTFNPDPLCFKDTLIKLENGYSLKYRICDYLLKSGVPTVRSIDPYNNNEKFSETLEKFNTVDASGILAFFKIEKLANDTIMDEVLIPYKTSMSAKLLTMEYFDANSRMWLPAQFQYPKKSINERQSFLCCVVANGGYYRIMALDQNKNAVLIRAPKGTAFTTASIQKSVYSYWEGTPVNGGTAMLFLLPKLINDMTVQYSIIDENGKIKYSGVQDWEHMVGHQFKIKSSSKNYGVVHGLKVNFPEKGYQIYDDFDNEKTVTLKHIN
ncbi:MAG: hypothetical protein ACKOX3_07715 [Bacteroidota bacterium]